jgi:hypothetical protein
MATRAARANFADIFDPLCADPIIQKANLIRQVLPRPTRRMMGLWWVQPVDATPLNLAHEEVCVWRGMRRGHSSIQFERAATRQPFFDCRAMVWEAEIARLCEMTTDINRCRLRQNTAESRSLQFHDARNFARVAIQMTCQAPPWDPLARTLTSSTLKPAM